MALQKMRLTKWELELAEGICSNLHLDTLFHHDDWGGLGSTFMSLAMFDQFLPELYKEIYGYYHSHGVELVIHYSDSYAETLVPSMIGTVSIYGYGRAARLPW